MGAAWICLAAAVAWAAPAITNGVHVGAFSYWDYRFLPNNLVIGDTAGALVDGNGNGIEEHNSGDSGGWPQGGQWFGDFGSADLRWLVINLNGLYSVEKMRVWNYNRAGETTRQMQTAPIEVSTDGIQWTLVTNMTFKQIVVSGTLEDVDDVAFGNAQARLVRIGNPTNGWTNYGDGDKVGLSEIRFYGTAVSTPACYRIAGSNIAVTASSEGVAYGRYATNTVSSAGFLEDADGDGIPPHDTDTSHMWFTQSGLANVSNQWIQFQFAQPVALDRMLVWNMNYTGSGHGAYQTRQANIRCSLDGAMWTTLAAPGRFTQSLGADSYEAVDQFSFGGVLARYVRLEDFLNFNANNFDAVGLSKVWFYARSPTASGTVFRFR